MAPMDDKRPRYHADVPMSERLVDLESHDVITIQDPFSADDVAAMLEDEPEPAFDPAAAAEEVRASVKGDVGTLPGVPIIGSSDVVNSGPARS